MPFVIKSVPDMFPRTSENFFIKATFSDPLEHADDLPNDYPMNDPKDHQIMHTHDYQSQNLLSRS